MNDYTFSSKPFQEVTLESIKKAIDTITPLPFNKIAMNRNAIQQLIEQAKNISFKTIYGYDIIESNLIPDGYFFFFMKNELVGILYPDGKYINVKEAKIFNPKEESNG